MVTAAIGTPAGNVGRGARAGFAAAQWGEVAAAGAAAATIGVGSSSEIISDMRDPPVARYSTSMYSMRISTMSSRAARKASSTFGSKCVPRPSSMMAKQRSRGKAGL